MKKYLSIILAVIMIFSVIAVAGCSKGGSDEEKEPEVTTQDVPENYDKISYDNEFYGISVSMALPIFDKGEGEDKGSGHYVYTGYINSAEYKSYRIDIYTNTSDEYSKESTFSNSGGVVETIELAGQETCKYTRDNASSGKETDYDVYIPFLDGYAHTDINVAFLNDDVSDEQWTEIIDAVEKYTVVSLAETNGLTTSDGRLYDASGTMAFANPSNIGGVSAQVAQQVYSGNGVKVVATADIDGIEHRVVSFGNVTDSVFNSRKENTEEYTACDAGGYTYYCHMINRFPNVECDVYVEIDGVYYSFYVFRDHNLDVDANKAYVADTANNQFFADLVNDFVSNAKIDTSALEK